MAKKILPDCNSINTLHKNFFVTYTRIAEWMGVTRERVRQIVYGKEPKKQMAWESKTMTEMERRMALEAADTKAKQLTTPFAETICLNNGEERAVVIITPDNIKCVFDIPHDLLMQIEEIDPTPKGEGEIIHKDGVEYFKPTDKESFYELAQMMHMTTNELSMKLYGAPVFKFRVKRTDEDVREALDALSVNGVVRPIPKEYLWIRTLAYDNNMTVKSLVNSFGYRYGGCEKPGRLPWSEGEIEFLWENYQKKGVKWCADHLPGRTEQAILIKAQKIGATRERNEWLEVEDDFIRKNYAKYGPLWCAERLRRHPLSSCSMRANKLGVKYQGKRGVKAWADTRQ